MMQQMQAWIKATLINGAITGISTGLLLHFIGVQPAMVFGTLAFFGEFVPNIGPAVTSLPALFVALGSGPEKAGLTLLAIAFVQQVESNLLVPFIMGRHMELHPVAIVFSALAMGSLFGIVGAVLAVPTAAAAKILIDEFYLRPRNVIMADIEAEADTVVESRPPRLAAATDTAPETDESTGGESAS
jgi:predicted PurR-regulated permease PerM